MRKLEVQEQSQGNTKLLTWRGLDFWQCLRLRELRGMDWDTLAPQSAEP